MSQHPPPVAPGVSGTMPPRHGIPVWLCTAVVAIVLRSVSGQGTAPAFVVAATVVLGLLLLGWRAVPARLAARG